MTKLRRWVTAEARAPQEISQSEKQFVISQTRSKRSNCINTLELSTKFRERLCNTIIKWILKANSPSMINFVDKFLNITVFKRQFSIVSS